LGVEDSRIKFELPLMRSRSLRAHEGTLARLGQNWSDSVTLYEIVLRARNFRDPLSRPPLTLI
jgi:hypothetical protein